MPYRAVHTIRRCTSFFLLLALGASSIPTTQDTKLADADLTVHKIYAEQFASRRLQDRATLAKNLLAQGRIETADPARREVLFRDARDIATEIGDVLTACAAATELANDTHANPVELRGATLVSLAAHLTTDKAKPFLEECVKLADEALASGDYAPASRVLTLADKPAQSLKDPLLLSRIRQLTETIATRARNADSIKQAEDLLLSHPDNAIANTLVGRSRCFALLDWKTGLPCLAKSDDASLQLAAASDLAAKSPLDTLRAADAWWDIAQKEVGQVRTLTSCRAARFYEKSFPSLTGSDRDRAAARILQSLNVPLSDGQTYRDDPQALETLLGPHQSATVHSLTFRKFSIRTDNPALKRIAVQLEIAATKSLMTADHADIRLRFLCRDSADVSHILEIRRALKVKEPGVAVVHFIGPDTESVKRTNAGA